MSKQPNYYRILGIAPIASENEIKHAYRGLAKHYHPDTMPPEKRDWAREQMVRINAAYQVLQNPQRRAEYDRLRGYANSLPPQTSSPPANHALWRRQRERRRRQQSQRWRIAATACAALLVASLLLTVAFARTSTAYVVAAAIDGALMIALITSLAMVNR
ncbi:MAG: J domain-containing protein [Anaerolineae bacterium]|nr:J domain-containing protein [Anaerolineae bacterium]